MGLEDREILEEVVEALKKEGGEATLERLVYAYRKLTQVGGEKILEVVRGSDVVEASEKTLYRNEPELHRYILLRLAGDWPRKYISLEEDGGVVDERGR